MPPDYFSGAVEASLEQVLDARERRASRQRTLLQANACPLVSFTLNIPGAYKTYALAQRAFREGMRAIEAQLARWQLAVIHTEEYRDNAGFEGYFCVDADAGLLKRRMVEIEEGHALGRLFDIDVLGQDAVPLRGSESGRGTRSCLICGRPVWECARSRAHPAEQLALETARRIDRYFAEAAADRIASSAVRALLHEVAVTPKPGLVDRAGNGAHRDMDFFTFLDSGCALAPFFREIALAGLRFEGAPDEMLPALRYPGQCAEEAMLRATGGVNTHKGLIFSLGLICAAYGYLCARGETHSPEELFACCACIAAAAPAELRIDAPASNGTQVYDRHGFTGARGEAAAGFPAVRLHGYPQLRRAAESGDSINDAGVVALLHLMAAVDDTNIVSRSNGDTLRRVQAQACELLERQLAPQELLAAVAEMDEAFIESNLSPGGSADLLALSLMVYFLYDA